MVENHEKSRAYWKKRLVDFQVIASRRHLYSLMVTFTMNPWREELGWIGLDTVNRNTLLPSTDKPRVLERPGSTDRVNHKFSNDVKEDLRHNKDG